MYDMKPTINPSDPAFPYEEGPFKLPSLSIRAELAARAMQGLLANPSENEVTMNTIFEKLGLPKDTEYNVFHYFQYMAKQSTMAADALIEALNAETKKDGSNEPNPHYIELLWEKYESLTDDTDCMNFIISLEKRNDPYLKDTIEEMDKRWKESQKTEMADTDEKAENNDGHSN